MNKKPNGFVLIEASLTYIVLTFAIVTLMPLFILCLRSNKATEYAVVSTQLSTELLEEMRLRKWDHNTPQVAQVVTGSTALGPNAGDAPLDKRTFNDLDDFNGWSEDVPMNPVMQPLALKELRGYKRSVEVHYVDQNFKLVSTPSDYKQVTVCTQKKPMVPTCLDTIFTNR